jgi:hypothetical protein
MGTIMGWYRTHGMGLTHRPMHVPWMGTIIMGWYRTHGIGLTHRPMHVPGYQWATFRDASPSQASSLASTLAWLVFCIGLFTSVFYFSFSTVTVVVGGIVL